MLTINGQIIETTIQEVQSAREPWCEYLLTDGTVIRAKLVVTRIHRLATPASDGQPAYVLESQTVVARG